MPENGKLSYQARSQLHFRFWQEANYTVFDSRGRVARSISDLICDRILKPIRYDIRTDCDFFIFKFKDSKYTYRAENGKKSKSGVCNANYLLAGNSPPQLALMLKHLPFNASRCFSVSFFSPESLSSLLYKFTKRADGKLSTNHGELITLDKRGWLRRLENVGQRVTVLRVRRQFPKWRFSSSTEFNSGQAKYVQVSRPEKPKEFAIKTARGTLNGSIVLPKTEVPLVATYLFLGGSGTHDRYGVGPTFDIGYHELIATLASRGLAGFCFDKWNAGSVPHKEGNLSFGFDEAVSDAKSVCDLLFRHKSLSNLSKFIIGHSQGGLIAIELARTLDVQGVVLLSTASDRFELVVESQIKKHFRELDFSEEYIDHMIKVFRNRLCPESVDLTLGFSVSDGSRKLLRELCERDPIALIGEICKPLLIVHGSFDSQVPVASAAKLFRAASSTEKTVKVFHGLDHLFKQSSGIATLRGFYDRRLRVNKQFIKCVGDWIIERTSGKN